MLSSDHTSAPSRSKQSSCNRDMTTAACKAHSYQTQMEGATHTSFSASTGDCMSVSAVCRVFSLTPSSLSFSTCTGCKPVTSQAVVAGLLKRTCRQCREGKIAGLPALPGIMRPACMHMLVARHACLPQLPICLSATSRPWWCCRGGRLKHSCLCFIRHSTT